MNWFAKLKEKFKGVKGWFFPFCMFVLTLITTGICIFATNAEGVWLFPVFCTTAGVANAIYNKVVHKVWFF